MERKMIVQEVESWYVLPLIRREIVNEMFKRGLKNKDIADKLGITRSAVSQYVKKKRAAKFKLKNNEQKIIKDGVDLILKGENPVTEIQRILNFFRERKVVCRLHVKNENMPLNCGICFPRRIK